jgi:hypothetical protein
MASLLSSGSNGETKTDTCEIFHEFLLKLNLERYIDALLEAGYEDFECFDFEYTPIEEMLNELINEVKMKKPLARKLLVYLRKQKEGTLNEQRTGQQEHVQDEEIDIDDLPTAHEVVAVGSSTTPSAFDFDSMKKEMQQQMEVEFNTRLDERLAEEFRDSVRAVKEHHHKEAERARDFQLKLLKANENVESEDEELQESIINAECEDKKKVVNEVTAGIFDKIPDRKCVSLFNLAKNEVHVNEWNRNI